MFKTVSQTYVIQTDTIANGDRLRKTANQAALWPASRQGRVLYEVSPKTVLILGNGSMRVPQHMRRNGPIGMIRTIVTRPIPTHMCLAKSHVEGPPRRDNRTLQWLSQTPFEILCDWMRSHSMTARMGQRLFG